jgi:hypothetical protein
VILIVLALLGVLSVPLSGGDLGRLGELRIRHGWAALLALGAQVILTTVAPGGSEGLHEAAHISTYVLLLLFLWENRAIPGALVIGAGAALNALVITLNHGVMPESATAHRIAGLPSSPGFHNSAVIAHPVLLWFADVIPVPGPFGLGNTLSAGDCLIYTGLVILLVGVTRPSGRGLAAPAWLRRAAS